MILKNKIKTLLEEQGKTQISLSYDTRLPATTINSLVNSENLDRHRISTLYLVARALDVRIEDLFEVIE